MSEHYKTIRKAREAVKELKAQAWNDTKIAKHIGVSVSIIKDIVVLDEVAMNLREPTIEKFRKFLDTRSAAKQHFADQEEKSEPEPELKDMGKEDHKYPEYDDPGPPPYKGKKIPMPEDLLGQLNELSSKFASKGYRLDCTLTLQKLPRR